MALTIARVLAAAERRAAWLRTASVRAVQVKVFGRLEQRASLRVLLTVHRHPFEQAFLVL